MAIISIVIPILNGDEFIDECINSLINQTLSDIEIIFVDAGSTDNTLSIIGEYAAKDSRITILHSDKKSMGYQYNLGIAYASGEYIGFCEADDYIDTSMFENLYESISDNDIDFIKSDFDMFVDKEKRIFLNYNILDNSKNTLYNKVIVPHEHPEILQRDVNMWNGIYKSSFVKNICLNETPKAAFQDTGFVLKTFLYAKKGMYVSFPSYHYRRDNSGSSVYSPDTIIFVNQEFQFAFDTIFNNCNDINGYCRVIVLKRFLDMFGGFYNYLPDIKNFSDEIKTAIKDFTKRFIKEYNDTDYRYIEALDLHVIMNAQLLLEEKMDLFDQFRKEVSFCNSLKWRKFKMEMEKFDKIVFWGSSEANLCAAAFLLNNNLKNISAICDDTVKSDKEILGIKVVSSEFAKNLEDAVFIIDNYSYESDSYKRLKNMGIDDGRIYKAVKIPPHTAFEVIV